MCVWPDSVRQVKSSITRCMIASSYWLCCPQVMGIYTSLGSVIIAFGHDYGIAIHCSKLDRKYDRLTADLAVLDIFLNAGTGIYETGEGLTTIRAFGQVFIQYRHRAKTNSLGHLSIVDLKAWA
jgi:hypothetical protein